MTRDLRAGRWRSLAGLLLVCAAVAAGMAGLQSVTDRRVAAEVASQVRPGDIQMIASIDCPYCAQARTWFAERRVPYSECTIETDADCATLYRRLMAPGTPVLLVRGQRLVGFRAADVLEALQRPQ